MNTAVRETGMDQSNSLHKLPDTMCAHMGTLRDLGMFKQLTDEDALQACS